MRIDKREKTISIIHRVISLLLAVPFLILFIVDLTQEYPPEESLVYEQCTFVKYEYILKESRKSPETEYYEIYVEEYDIPLRIDNIAFHKANGAALSELKKGDKITLSIEFYREDLHYLYSISCGDTNILSYKDYIEAHSGNDKYGFIICPILFSLGIGLFIAEVIYYKKTGRSLPWPCSV